ncbi:MAG: prolyl oligopeptidase family serine peptidase [Myxococcota bacterium]
MGRRSGWRWLGWTLAALVGLAASVFVLLTVWWRGWHVERQTPDALLAFLEPTFELRVPSGAGPHPTVVQFHGCGGLRANQRSWAARFVEAGWASLIVDSNGPRSLTPSWVCSGLSLSGMERAGDVWVALEHARAQPQLDAERIVLAGWSHGAWAIFELLDRNTPDRLPHNLSGAPPGGLAGIAGLLFVYPFCGMRDVVPPRTTPSLFVLAGADQITPPEACEVRARLWERAGQPARVTVLDGAHHAFDERHPPGVGVGHDAASTRAAQEEAVAFLEALEGPTEVSAPAR